MLCQWSKIARISAGWEEEAIFALTTHHNSTTQNSLSRLTTLRAMVLDPGMASLLLRFATSDREHPVEIVDSLATLLCRSRDSIRRSLEEILPVEADTDFITRDGVVYMSKEAFLMLCTATATSSRHTQKETATECAKYFKKCMHEHRRQIGKDKGRIVDLDDEPKRPRVVDKVPDQESLIAFIRQTYQRLDTIKGLELKRQEHVERELVRASPSRAPSAPVAQNPGMSVPAPSATIDVTPPSSPPSDSRAPPPSQNPVTTPVDGKRSFHVSPNNHMAWLLALIDQQIEGQHNHLFKSMIKGGLCHPLFE